MKPVILLLEDDRQLSDTVRQFLLYKGYDVLCAFDGDEAEEIFYEKHIDLMLLDVKVPHQSGFAFLKRVRGQGCGVPVIFITSLNSVEDVEEGFAAGCDDYVRKPFALKELLVRVESLLRRSYGVQEERVSFGEDLMFDFKALRLYRADEPVALKTKECKLLALFLRHRGELLPYDKIYEALWEYDEEPSSGALRTYIKNLRSIIGRDCIETVKNGGYRFVE